jgi:adenylate cyclase
MVVRVGESLYPALGLDVLRGLAGDPSYQVRGSETGIEAVRVPSFDTINTDAAGRVWIDWASSFSQEPIDGTIIFVGVTAAGVTPLVPTPRGLMFPHQVQATLFETLLAGTSPVRPDWALGAEFLAILLLGLSTALVASRLPVLSVPVGVLAIGVLTATSSVWGYLRFGVLVDAAFPVISSLIVGSVGVGQRMISEYRQKLKIKGMFGTYVSPKLVQQLVDDPSLMKLGGDTKTLSFLFCDIVGFTPISEHFKNNNDPQGLVTLINRLLSSLTDVVLSLDGTIDKYMGDCLMAFWGAPVDCDDHEERAVTCAGLMLVALEKLNKEIESEGLPKMGIGIGVNTGPCVIGNMGGEKRFDYSAIGDAVNVAARLESSTRKFTHDVLIGETTAKAVHPFMVQPLDSIEVKGKSEKLSVYTLSEDAIHAAHLADYWAVK